MNDAVTFTMLYVEHLIKRSDVLNCTREQISIASKLYESFCDQFYQGTRWEYDIPDYTELVLGMIKYIQENC